MAESLKIDADDLIRIMVATDNHLGCLEKDAIRGDDSFIAFEEILELAVSENVDFILLGGDLFHDAVPSQNAMNKCMKLLRRYTFGDKPIALEFLSDQSVNFHNAMSQTVNYEDPNLNVSIPVFSIHGNHDDPSGFGRLSSLDLLSTTGLVNYFGRWTDLTKVEISPLLLRKGETQLALYGLSHIHDARLARLFENYKVTIESPSSEKGDWFHLMVLHQNRADRGPKNYLPEEALPTFLNLLIWGHEHDCRIEPEYNHNQDFYVSQPGSSVHTSLSEGEAIKKHVGILEIYKTKFQMKPLPLQTVRPFIYESVHLAELGDELDLDGVDVSNTVKKWAEKRIEAMIERAEKLLTGHPMQPTLPSIRLRLVYSEEKQMFNAIRLGQTFNQKVANPGDIILFKKLIKKSKQENIKIDQEAMDSAFEKMDINVGTRVEDLVDQYFDLVGQDKKLKLFSSKVLSEMCHLLVTKNDTNAADLIIKFYKDKALEHLMETMPSEEKIDAEVNTFKNKTTPENILKMLDERGPKIKTKPSVNKAADKAKSNFVNAAINSPQARTNKAEENSATNTASSTRGRGRGRGGRNTSTTAATNKSRISGRPKLDITVTSARSTRQTTLLDAMGPGLETRRKKANTYVISSDSDSD